MLHHQLNFELSFFHTFVYINVVLNLNLFAFTWSSPPINIWCFLISIQFIYSPFFYRLSSQEETKISELIDSWVGAQVWCLRVDPLASEETSYNWSHRKFLNRQLPSRILWNAGSHHELLTVTSLSSSFKQNQRRKYKTNGQTMKNSIFWGTNGL